MPTIPPLPASSGASATPDRFSSLSTEDFVRVMFSELAKQDPLKPNDSAALLEQMSSIRSIQSDLELSKKLESIVSQGELSTAGALIGKVVSGLNEQNQRVEGTVRSVSRTADGPVITLTDGTRVAFDRIDRMEAAAEEEEAAQSAAA